MKSPIHQPANQKSNPLRTIAFARVLANRLNYNPKLLLPALLVCAFSALVGEVEAQTYLPYTFTNYSGVTGVAGDSAGTGQFNNPLDVAADNAGNLYVTDGNNNQIRKVASGGHVTLLAGNGAEGYVDGPAASAEFNIPFGATVDSAGNVFIGDQYNHAIRKIDTAGNVTTWAGGTPGSANGIGTNAQFYYPAGVAVDSAGNVFVADYDNQTIRKIDSAQNVTLIAGQVGVTGSADGKGTAAQFNQPSGIAVDSHDNLYVVDCYNYTIRKIDTAGNVTTLAGVAREQGYTDGHGTAALFYYPRTASLDPAGNLYVADTGNETVRKIDTAGNVTTLAGTALIPGSANGIGPAARFNNPVGVTVDSADNAYVADSSNDEIRKIDTSSNVTTYAGVAGESGPTASAEFNGPLDVAADSARNVYVVDGNNNQIRKIDTAGHVTVLAGNGGRALVNGPAASAEFSLPFGVTVAGNGNVFVGDQYNHAIRKIDTAGNVTTWAGGTPGSANGIGTNAQFYYPAGVAVDSAGNVFVADYDNQTIRKIDSAQNVTLIAGQVGVTGSADGNGTAAQFNQPSGIAVDGNDNLYVVDCYNYTIRKIDTNGNVTTLAGIAQISGDSDGQGTAALFYYPRTAALDSAGNLYIADTGNETIRRMDPAGNVTTLAGTPLAAGSANGTGSGATFNNPVGITVDNAGNVYVADFSNDRISIGVILRPTITVSFSGGQVVISWSLSGILQSAPNPAGPYMDLPSATSPYSTSATGTEQFYRVRLPEP